MSEGIHESELPYIPEREFTKSPWEVDVQDTDVKYLRIPKRIGCHTDGIPKGNCPPLPSERKVRSSAQKRLDRILMKIGHKYHQGRSRNVLQTGRQELDASVVPLKAVNAVLNEDETETRTLCLRFLSRCFWMNLALFTKKYTTSGTDGARSSYLRKRRNLKSVNNSTCSTVKPSLNVTTTKKAPYSFTNLPTCYWRTSGFTSIQPGPSARTGALRRNTLAQSIQASLQTGPAPTDEYEVSRFRKEATILKEEKHTFPKGSANHGQASPGLHTSHWETCAKNFADTCYTASGLRAESQQQLTKLLKGAE